MAKNKLTDEQMKQLINDLKRDKPVAVTDELGSADDQRERGHSQISETPTGEATMSETQPPIMKGTMQKYRNLKLKLAVAIILTIPVILLSKVMGMTLPFTLKNIPHQAWVVLALATVVFLYSGGPFFKGAWYELKNKKPATMLLVTLASLTAYGYSVYATVMNYLHPASGLTDFFWGLVSLIDIMLVGLIIETKALMKADSVIDTFDALLPKVAHRIDNQKTTTDVAIAELQVGDHVVVRAAEKIPADGIIIAGETTTDEAMLTGEATQVIKQVADYVLGGSTNNTGEITIKITKAHDDRFLTRVQTMVTQAQGQNTTTETLADKVAKRLFYLAIMTSILAFVVWLIIAGFNVALPIAVTVLVIACPHALGLAVPVVTARLTSLAAKRGLLIQQRAPLEKVNKIKYALMDKTGTLTEGNFKIRTLKSVSSEYSDSDILAIMATLEDGSTHPLAQGIIALAKAKQVGLMNGSEIESVPGVGVDGVINNQRFALVSIDYLRENNVPFDQDYFDKLAYAGNSVSFLVTTQKVVGIVAQGDGIKVDAIKFVRELKKRGIIPVMLTGDNPVMAKRVAKSLEITDVQAQLKPDDKARIVREYQQKGAVMMIGDGVNDSPALVQADLGIAIGAGTDIAIDTADVVLVNSNPADILTLLELAKASNTKMRQNLRWLTIYNIIALIVAAGVLKPFGIILNPVIAAILTTAVTVGIIINATNLKIKNKR